MQKANKKLAKSYQKVSNKQKLLFCFFCLVCLGEPFRECSIFFFAFLTKASKNTFCIFWLFVVWFAWGNLLRNLAFLAFWASEHTSAGEPMGVRKKLIRQILKKRPREPEGAWGTIAGGTLGSGAQITNQQQKVKTPKQSLLGKKENEQ